ncbi:MAG: Ig-like domain-containing protein [Gemmatimonadaceae bacterium]
MKNRIAVALLFALAAAGCSDAVPTGTKAVETIELTSPAATVRAGGTLTLGVRLRDADGKPVDNVAVYWSSSNSSVATVSGVGVVTANTAGEVVIAASALGKSATTKISVADREVATVQIAPTSVSVRIGTTVPLLAQTTDAEGNALSNRQITWTSGNLAVATVNSAGVVTGVSAGAATITAASEGRSGTAAVTVTLNPVAAVTITPSSDTLGVGTDQTLVATLRDAGGTVLTNRGISWNSSNVQVATVSSTGVVTALSPGTVTISAVSESHVGSANILVLARLASTVTLTPSSTTIIVGTALQLTPQITDPAGNILIGRPISYESDDPSVATVSATGLVKAVAPGTARITANSEGKVGIATIVVNPLPVASVVVTPGSATVLTNATRQLSFQALSSTGATLANRAVSWTSGSPSVATVSATGLVTPVGPGVALIVAQVEGVAGFSTITVQLPLIASVSVTANANSVPVGATLQLTATPRDNAAAALPNRVVTWSSSDESIAFVTSNGLVVGISTGLVTITATSEGVRGQIGITVR